MKTRFWFVIASLIVIAACDEHVSQVEDSIANTHSFVAPADAIIVDQFAGFVNGTGEIAKLPAGWTVTIGGSTGTVYTITHNLALLDPQRDLLVIGSSMAGAVAPAMFTTFNHQADSFEVHLRTVNSPHPTEGFSLQNFAFTAIRLAP